MIFRRGSRRRTMRNCSEEVESMPPPCVYLLFEEISDQHGTSKPIGVFMHELTEAEQQAKSPTRRTYLKKFEVHP